MPPIHFLNPPPHPFWAFVSDMENHPLFTNQAGPARPDQQTRGGDGEPTTASAGPAATNNEKDTQQTNADDPPEVDPSTVRPSRRDHHHGGPDFRARERHHRRCGSSSGEEGAERRRRGECGGARGWGRHGPRGFGGPPPPPHAGPFGPGFPFAGFPGAPFGAGRADHPHGPPPHHPHDFWSGARGRGGFGPRGEHRHGLRRHQHPLFPFGPGHGPRGHSPPSAGGPGGFDLGQFLNNLGERIGMDLSGAAQNLGLDRFIPSHGNPDVDFEPKFDIFDLAEQYIIHLSLPGAKKSDIGVDWDGEHSALRVAGVVHRPDVDEAMLGQLAVDGRRRETGVFEKTIRLGTRRDPANIDVSHITARMRDGVLVVVVPKVERASEKREVPISKSASVSPVRADESVSEKEKDILLFDADNDVDHAMPDHDTTHHNNDDSEEIQMIDRNTFEQSSSNKGKQAEYEVERNLERRESSATVEAEPQPQLRGGEDLPAYQPVDQHEHEHEHEHHDGSDWEHFDSDEEGEFVKINVE